jgi:hypothetical protein
MELIGIYSCIIAVVANGFSDEKIYKLLVLFAAPRVEPLILTPIEIISNTQRNPV